MTCVDDIMTKFDNSCHDINYESHVLIQYDVNENKISNILGLYKVNDTNIVKDIVHIEVNKDIDLVDKKKLKKNVLKQRKY